MSTPESAVPWPSPDAVARVAAPSEQPPIAGDAAPTTAATTTTTTTTDLDPVWRALSDPTRRALLDRLRDGPQNTTALCEQFEHLSRQAVIKHLKTLERAGLVWVESRGRERINHLDVGPIEAIYQRWMRPYHSYWLTHLQRLADEVERSG